MSNNLESKNNQTLLKKLAGEISADRLLIKNIEVHSIEEANEWLPSKEEYRRYDYDGSSLIVKGADKKTGAPTRDTLDKLGLKSVADDLEKTGIYQ